MFFLYPLFAVIIWSINSIVSKLSADAIDPAAISFYRWLLALLVLTPFVLPGVWRTRQVIKPHLWRLAILGLLGMVLYQSLAYYAAQSVSALFMGIIGALIPLLTVLLSVVILRIAATRGLRLGRIISFTGLVWLVSEGNVMQLLNHGLGKGELLMLAASYPTSSRGYSKSGPRFVWVGLSCHILASHALECCIMSTFHQKLELGKTEPPAPPLESTKVY